MKDERKTDKEDAESQHPSQAGQRPGAFKAQRQLRGRYAHDRDQAKSLAPMKCSQSNAAQAGAVGALEGSEGPGGMGGAARSLAAGGAPGINRGAGKGTSCGAVGVNRGGFAGGAVGVWAATGELIGAVTSDGRPDGWFRAERRLASSMSCRSNRSRSVSAFLVRTRTATTSARTIRDRISMLDAAIRIPLERPGCASEE